MPKRTILLTLFILFGFLPTLGLLLLGGYRQTGWYVRNYETWSEKALGLPVEVASITHHTPSNGRLHGVRIFQPGLTADGMRLPLASAPWADWLTYDVLSEGRELRRTKWTLPELTLDSQSLEPLWTAHQRMLGSGDWKNRELVLTVEGPVRVGFDAEFPLELHQAELRIRTVKGSEQTDIVFTVPESGREAQIVLSLRRIVQGATQVMQATLTTDTGGLPTRYLSSLFPMLEALGKDCRFTGSIAIQQSFSRWSGFFRGRFDQVDVSAFLLPGSLTGSGTLEIEKARFDGARLMLADGTFRILQGSISPSLLAPILRTTQLVLRRPTAALPVNGPIGFRELAFHFQVHDSQMQIFGQCEGFGAGVFITGPDGPILGEPAFHRNPFSRAVFMEDLKMKKSETLPGVTR